MKVKVIGGPRDGDESYIPDDFPNPTVRLLRYHERTWDEYLIEKTDDGTVEARFVKEGRVIQPKKRPLPGGILEP